MNIQPELFFLAQTKPRQEQLAASHLLQQGFFVVAPRIPKRGLKRVRRDTVVDQPLFPGYVFVAPSEASPSLNPVRSTVGVTRLVKFGEKPATIGRKSLESILFFVEHHQPSDLVEGTVVRVRSGPFRDLIGLVSEVAEDRVTVLMEILGREQKLCFQLDDLEV